MQTLKKLLFLLSPDEIKYATFLLILISLTALLDMIGIASIFPFVAVLTNPDLINTNHTLNYIFQISSIFGIVNHQQFIFALGIFTFLFLIISLAFKSLTIYLQTQFVHTCEHSIGKRIIEGNLQQPYSWFLSRSNSDFGKNILSEINLIILNGLHPLIELVSKSLIVIILMTLLVIVDAKLAFVISLIISIVYLLIFYFFRRFVDRIGKECLKNDQLRFDVVIGSFSAIKEIKIGGLEQTYINIFSRCSKIFAQTRAFLQVIAQLPRFILEAVTFGGVLLMTFYLMSQTNNLNAALPIISLFIFAGYRLIPAAQHIYTSFAQITFVIPSLNKLYYNLRNLETFNESQDLNDLIFHKKITLQNIHYNYPNSSQKVLKDISLVIPVKSIIGFVGATGSGKTTLIDIILGLLVGQKGSLEVDGKLITKNNVRSWQRSIGYVPQQIYLSDDTVAANIAFGSNPKRINKDLIEKVSKIANLHEFIINELPQQYQTIIGETGVGLSGGQRQRIGIARALYREPKLLIMDEATSALDNLTEKKIIQAIKNLKKNMTIILVTHNLYIIKACDLIFELDKGMVINRKTKI
jgi:ABC-type bacteriocin/lantibiotic exporter with double-glycine peptidase domain